MNFNDVYDDKTAVVKVNISDEMRMAASCVAGRYWDILVNDPAVKKMSKAAAQQTALVKLEVSGQFRQFLSEVFHANPHLDPSLMGGHTQRLDMRAASGSALNQLIIEEGAKLNIQMPELFNTWARSR